MKENSREENIKILEKNVESVKENSDGAFFETDEDYYFFKAVDYILSDYKRVLKENEELRKELNEENKRCMMLAAEKQDYFEKYKYHLQQNERLTKEFSNVIPVQKVKDKIEFLKKEGYWLFTTDRDSDKCVETLQELIEKED